MTLQQANSLIERADNLFKRAAKALDRGHNSQDKAYMAQMQRQCNACRKRGEDMLAPLGITVAFPSLYPCFQVAGITYHTTESAVSAALEANKGKP